MDPLPCGHLYDPCTRELIPDNSIEILEQRIKELKQALKPQSEFPEFPDTIRNRLQLLLHLIQSETPPTYRIFQYKKGGNQNFGTSLFEAYWDVALCLGLIHDYRLSIPGRYMVNSKVEDLKAPLKFADKQNFIGTKYLLKSYLEQRKVMATSEQGASDITIAYSEEYVDPPEATCLYTPQIEPAQPKKQPLFYLFSSKFFKKEKSVSSYDVERIHLAAKHLKHLKAEIKIPILANNKASLDGYIERALSRFVAEEIYETYGAEELLTALNIMYDRIRVRYPNPADRTADAVADVFGLSNTAPSRDFFTPRFHQIMAIEKISDAITNTRTAGFTAENNKFLVGVLPRGGKTYIVGGIVERLQPKIVLVILGAKSETLKQFTDDLFNKFQNFANYTVVNLLDKTQDLKPDTQYIVISSIELLVKESQGTAQGRKIMERILSKEPGYKADLILYDEAHLKGTRGRGREALGAVAKKQEQQQQADGSETDAADADEDEKEEQILSQIDNCPIVFFTGTYRKPRDRFKIPDTKMIVWDYEDVQRGKSLMTELAYFKTHFGNYVDQALDQLQRRGITLEAIEAGYKKFPELYLLTTNFNDVAKQELNPVLLDFPNLFAIEPKYNFKDTEHELWHRALKQHSKIENILNYLAPSRTAAAVAAAPKYRSVIDRIDELAQMAGDRLRGIASSPNPGKEKTHSQIWFMPRTVGLGSLPDRMMAFSSLIVKQEWFAKNFDVVCVYTKGKEHTKPEPLIFKPHNARVLFQPFICKGKKTLKDCLVDYETAARERGRGLIILAQDKLKLGISLPCVEIVVLLDDNKDVDERIQKMYRVLTESDDKKAGFVVDMNYFRCVNSVIEYHLTKDRTKRRQDLRGSQLDDILQTIFRGLLAFDPDRYLDLAVEKGSEMAEKQIKDEMRALYNGASEYSEAHDKDRITNIGKRLNAEVEEIVEEIEFDEKLLASLRLTKAEREREMKRLLRGPAKHVQKAQALLMSPDVAAAVAEEETQEPESERLRRTKEELYKTILKFGAFTGSVSDLETYLRDLLTPENRQTRLEIYDLLVKRDLLVRLANEEEHAMIQDLISLLLAKITDDSRGLFKTMKERVNSYEAKENFTEVLDYINKHLAPKDIERQKYGEIYTPLRLVDEMLDSLPEEVWSNPNLKWLDPANGMGNFPIKVFLRLSEGLKSKMNDPAKHIVENMLFMIDINGKNNEVARKLFKKLAPAAKANIEKIDAEKGFLANKPLIFNGKTIKDFDIIMGNPPYNPPKTETGSSGNSIWQNFVIKSHSMLNDKGYLLFVHPPGWKKPTDEVFKPEKFADGNYTGQIRQGQVWQVLKDSGVFKFIYTNDQKSKAVGEDYIDHFPAVDYYVYQKGGDNSGCDTKNVFLGTIEDSKGVRLNYNLKYLPNLITKQTQDILHKVTSKHGEKPDFKRGYDTRGYEATQESATYKYLYTLDTKGNKKYQYSEKYGDNIDIDKVIINWQGGIDSYYVDSIKSQEKIGVFDKIMYSKMSSDKKGKHLESFFKSDLVKFIFLITQYASGMRTVNEHFVANSITIPPEGTTDYYKFFEIEEHKKYIEEILSHYEKFKAPKRLAKTAKAKGGGRQEKRRFTRKARRA